MSVRAPSKEFSLNLITPWRFGVVAHIGHPVSKDMNQNDLVIFFMPSLTVGLLQRAAC